MEKSKLGAVFLAAAFIAGCASMNKQGGGDSAMEQSVPLAAIVKNGCIESNYNNLFGPRNLASNGESLSGIAATAAGNIIVDGLSALLASAAEERVETSVVETSFILEAVDHPKCF